MVLNSSSSKSSRAGKHTVKGGTRDGQEMEVPHSKTGMESFFDSARTDNNSSYSNNGSVNIISGKEGPVPSDRKLFPNRRPLPYSAKTYELEKFSEHLMLIFSYEDIPGYGKRLGNEADVAALTKCFEELRFKVNHYSNMTAEKVFSIMDEVTESDLSDYGCFAVVFLTHGANNGQLLTSNLYINENDIIQFMSGSTTQCLNTKPRLLIVQACRGIEVSSTVSKNGKITNFTKNLEEPHNLHIEADLLLLHSSYPGKVSMRPSTGSYFIQSLCRFLNESQPDEDIFSIFSKVTSQVSIVPKGVNEKYEKWGQVPTVTSTLSRRLYLKTKVEIDDHFQNRLSYLSGFVEHRSVEDDITLFATIMLKIARAIDGDKVISKKRKIICEEMYKFLQKYDSDFRNEIGSKENNAIYIN